MAVRIDIPGIGMVEADNAASEATLQAILAALDKDTSPKAKKSQKADEDAAKAAAEKAKADAAAAKVGKEFSVGWSAAGQAAVKGLKDIGLTAVSMAAKFGTDFVNIAENPIKETANMLNSLIDVGSNVVSSFAEAIPIIGAFISAATKAAAELAKAANKAFAEQLQRNIDTLQAYNKVGVSFAGGMNQMNTVAHNAGLGLSDFSKIVTKSKNDLNYLGLSGGAAATALSNGMGLTTKLIGKSGQTLRTEMFKLGYSYEEQGEVMASYMANLKASGRLESMTREELARGTRQYAADLKVVADFTGQDAKKLAERARQAQLNVAVQQQLTEEQRDRLGKATQMLARMGPEGERAQQALTQMLLRGANNVQGYTMGPGREMIETMMNNVKSGQEDVFQNAGRAMAKAQEQTSKDMTQGAVAVAKAFGVAGEASDGIASFQAGLFAMGKIGPEMISNAQNANEKQANTADKVADQTAALYDQTKKFQVLMETEVNKELGRYAGILKETNDLLQGNFMKFIRKLAGESEEGSARVKEARGPSGLGYHGMSNEQVLQKLDRDAWLKTQGITFNPASGQFYDSNGKSLGFSFDKLPNAPKYDKGGTIGAGKMGIAGENGPELIGGPANVLSTASTEKILYALDAMRAMKGTRFGGNDFEWGVGMTADRWATMQDRIKGFEGYDYSQLDAEIGRRGLKKDSQAIMDQWDKEERDNNSETVSYLAELVQLMKQNVNHTARVAVNTN